MRVLKGPPHAVTQAKVRRDQVLSLVGLLVILDPLQVLTSLVLVLLVATVAHVLRDDAEERKLLVVCGDALSLPVVQLLSTVKVKNVAENVWVPVKEVVVGGLVVEKVSLTAAQ